MKPSSKMKPGAQCSWRYRSNRSLITAIFLSMNVLPTIAHAQVAVPGAESAVGARPNTAAIPAAGSVLHLVFGLSNVKRAERDAFLKSQYDPKSPNYRKWLTPDEYGQRFGASAEDIQAVADYARAQGFQVTKIWPNRSFISADATVSRAEAAFGVKVQGFTRPGSLAIPGEPATFYAPSSAPAVPVTMASKIGFIAGLSNAGALYPSVRQAASRIKPSASAGVIPAGTAFSSALNPVQLSKIYNFDALHNQGAQGDGQTIAIFSPTGRYSSDVTTFATAAGISGYTISDVFVDGGPTNFNGSYQAAIDAEVVIGQAHHATITFYSPPNSVTGELDAYNQIATANPAVVSSSWGFEETDLLGNGYGWYAQAFDDITAQLANQGVSVFNKSGDAGAYNPVNSNEVTVSMEAASPNVTGVGGTSLPDSNNGSWDAENPWSFDGTIGSGGGLSFYFGLPWWQAGPGVANAYSNGFRQVPDVAALAGSPYYSLYANGFWGSWYGTGAATHLWAAATLLMNQLAGYRQGNLNQALYDLGANRPYAFHDILGGSDGVYPGSTGWDFLTGLGSANFGQLYNDLAKPTDLAPFNPTGYIAGWNNVIMIHSDPGSIVEPPQFDDVTTYYIDSAIANYGPADMTRSAVKILVDSTPQTYSTPSLPPFNFTWTGNLFPQKFTAGRHRITEIVNYDHAIWESNYSNNSFIRNITVNHVLQPSITSITPNPVAYGSTGQTLTINGTDFSAAATININGNPYSPATATGTQLTVAVPDSLFKSPATISLSVTVGSITSNTYNVAVNNCPTAIAAATSPNPPVSGKQFTLAALVTDPSGLVSPTGTVTFSVGASVLGTGTLVSVGAGKSKAIVTCPGMAASITTLTTAYSGDAVFAAKSMNTPLTVTTALVSATTMTMSPGSAVATQAVSFTFGVTGAAAAPTGNVLLVVNGASTALLPLSGGVAYVSLPLPVGTDSVYARYLGDATYQASNSPTASIVVTKMNTTTTVTSSNASSPYGSAVTLTASVKPVAPAAGPVTGSVQFFEGATSLATVTLDSSGNGKLILQNFTIGSHTITANYLGSANANTSSSAAFTQTITKAIPGVNMTSSLTTVLQGQTDTFKATVTGVLGVVPTGNVTFYDGAAALGTVALSSGAASLNTSSLPAGARLIKATYTGDSTYVAASSAVATITVKSNATTTAIAASPATAAYSAPVKLTATITPASTGYTAPTGTVTFKDGATTLGTATIVGTTAVYTTSALGIGSHSITAVYGGDIRWTTSASAASTVTIIQESTTASLTTSASTAAFGATVTFTSYALPVSPATLIPTGSIQFFDGTASLGVVTVDTTGKATLAISNLPIGTHSIKATYLGNATAATSSSGALTQTIVKANPTITITATATTVLYGQADKFTATVAGMPAGVPTGSVVFYDGTTSLGTVALSGGAASLSTAALPVGVHSIKATYNGDGNYGAISSTALSVTVITNATTTALAASPTTAVAGTSVTLTATVTPASSGFAAPTGNVTFKDGATVLGTVALSGANATLATSSLAAGTHTITATYNGDPLYKVSTSAGVSVKITP